MGNRWHEVKVKEVSYKKESNLQKSDFQKQSPRKKIFKYPGLVSKETFRKVRMEKKTASTFLNEKHWTLHKEYICLLPLLYDPEGMSCHHTLFQIQFLIYLEVWRNEQWSQDFTDEATSSLLSWRVQTKGELTRQVIAAISAYNLAFGLG